MYVSENKQLLKRIKKLWKLIYSIIFRFLDRILLRYDENCFENVSRTGLTSKTRSHR